MNMDAIIISVKGNLKPIALRHHVFEMGNTLGIRGYLNYRNGMHELLIHAEGENSRVVEFIHQINQLVIKHKIVVSTEQVFFEDFTEFKISHLDDALHRSIEPNNKSLPPVSINIPFAEAQITEQKQITTNNKSRKSAFRALLPFLKHAGL